MSDHPPPGRWAYASSSSPPVNVQSATAGSQTYDDSMVYQLLGPVDPALDPALQSYPSAAFPGPAYQQGVPPQGEASPSAGSATGAETITETPSNGKATRACDGCRNSKTKCIMPENAADVEKCQLCRKKNIECVFTSEHRQRGPQKGYIQALLHDAHYQQTLKRVVLGGTVETLAKRVLGIIAEVPELLQQFQHLASGAAPQAQPFPPQPPLRYVAQGADQDTATLQPPLRYVAQGADQDTITPARPSSPRYDEQALQKAAQEGIFLNDVDVNLYFSHIHSTTPLLPSSRQGIRVYLLNFSKDQYSAFSRALTCAVRCFDADWSDQKLDYEANQAKDLIFKAWPVASPGPNHLKVVSLMLLALQKVGGSRKPEGSLADYLYQALAESHSSKLRPSLLYGDESGTDCTQNLVTRITWTMYLMAHWHAMITGDPIVVPEDYLTLRKGDRLVLGCDIYKLIRYTKVLRHIYDAQVEVGNAQGATRGSRNALLAPILGEFEMLTENEAHEDDPFLMLVYLHVKLQLLKLRKEQGNHEFFALAQHSVDIIEQSGKHIDNPILRYVAMNIDECLSLCANPEAEDTKKQLRSVLTNHRLLPAWRAVHCSGWRLDRDGAQASPSTVKAAAEAAAQAACKTMEDNPAKRQRIDYDNNNYW